MKKFSVAFTLVFNCLTVAAAAASSIDVSRDFDSLGDNAPLVSRVRSSSNDNSVKVVQNKIVDQNLKFEIGVTGGLVAGGDSYFSTQNLGGNLEFHINSHWSLGVRYYHSYNQLTAEGQSLQQSGQAGYQLQSSDVPLDTGLAVINWSPIYGKIALGTGSVAHFNFYTTAGYGKTNLSISGPADTYAAGGGLGIWWTSHFVSRFEGRYQTYQEQDNSGPRRVDTAVFMGSIGFLL